MQSFIVRIKSLIKRALPVSTRMLIKNLYRRIHRMVRFVAGKEHLIGEDISIPKVRLGQDLYDWVVADRMVSRDSVGIDENITFDLALIERYGCQVNGWDPTPLAVNYIARIGNPSGFIFMPYGLGVNDYVMEFGAQDSGDRSFSLNSQHSSKISLEVRKMTSDFPTCRQPLDA